MAGQGDTFKEKSLQKQELVFWEDLKKNGEEIDLRYARALPDDTPKFILKMMAQFEKDVEEFSFEGCSGLVLDAGCGNGNILLRAMSKRPSKQPSGEQLLRYVGLDFSKNMLDMAASRVRDAPLVQGCINHLPFNDDARVRYRIYVKCIKP